MIMKINKYAHFDDAEAVDHRFSSQPSAASSSFMVCGVHPLGPRPAHTLHTFGYRGSGQERRR